MIKRIYLLQLFFETFRLDKQIHRKLGLLLLTVVTNLSVYSQSTNIPDANPTVVVSNSIASPVQIEVPNVYNYADSVIAFSSEWGSSWSHDEVLGHFNTYPCYGDISTSWASNTSGSQREFLELYFNDAAPIDSILIYETYNGGAIDTVYVKNPNTNAWEIVYTAISTNFSSSRILKIGFPMTSFDVSEVRIAINSIGTSWNEIDAVAINSKADGPEERMLDCNNSSITLESSCGSTDIGDATFAWSSANGNIVSGGNTVSAVVDAPGLYTLSVTKNNDIVHYSIQVNSNILIPDPVDLIQTLCTGENLTVNGTTYDALNPTGSETLTAANGCDSIVNISLTFLNTLTSEVAQTLCTGENLTVNGTTYDALNPTGSETLTAENGCDSIVNISLTFLGDYPAVANDYYVIIKNTDTIVDILSNDVLPNDWSLEMINASNEQLFVLNENGNLEIFGSQANNKESINITYQICDNTCSNLCSTGQVLVTFDFLEPVKEVLVSDVLTLNGDGKNDILFFRELSLLNMGIQIFNRWGDIVFSEKPYSNKWAGTNANGKLLPNGTYYYLLTINRAEGKFVKGDVLLVR